MRKLLITVLILAVSMFLSNSTLLAACRTPCSGASDCTTCCSNCTQNCNQSVSPHVCAWSVNNSCTRWCDNGNCNYEDPPGGWYMNQICCDGIHNRDTQVVGCDPCGNGSCDQGEDCDNCSRDCGSCCNTQNPSTPTPSSPTNGQTLTLVSQINLTWSASSWNEECGGSQDRLYNVCVGTNAGDPCSGGVNTNVSNSTDPAESYTYNQANNSTYYWKVRARNKAVKNMFFVFISEPPECAQYRIWRRLSQSAK